jgi:molybdopterin/thiamine biosynthesis adenylyltransferase
MELSELERATYAWQLPVAGFGEAGQRRLKGASVLVSRCGGVGGLVALELAAAGVGRLVLAHAGNLKPSDLNRQALMTADWVGRPRVECAARRLRQLNPRLEVLAIPQNASEENADRLVGEADLVVDCAPLFEERYALSRAAVRQEKPMVECAMYELEGTLTTFLPGRTGCLRCLYPDLPTTWKRRFPVFGAVSGAVGSIAAMEAIKVLADLGQPLANRLLSFDLRAMEFRVFRIGRDPKCRDCG